MTKKMKLEMKNRSHRYDINRSRPRDENKYANHKMCLSMYVLSNNKQHLRVNK